MFVLVSADTTCGICADLLRYILTEDELLTDEVNRLELRRMFKDRFQSSVEIIETIEAELRDEHIVPKPTKPSPLPIRDPDDRWGLASAVDGQADLLVTGDQDLLAIAGHAPLAIVDPRGCWDRLCRSQYPPAVGGNGIGPPRLRQGLRPDTCGVNGPWAGEDDVSRSILHLDEAGSMELLTTVDELELVPYLFPPDHHAGRGGMLGSPLVEHHDRRVEPAVLRTAPLAVTWRGNQWT